jgi:hypothetical protein
VIISLWDPENGPK